MGVVWVALVEFLVDDAAQLGAQTVVALELSDVVQREGDESEGQLSWSVCLDGVLDCGFGKGGVAVEAAHDAACGADGVFELDWWFRPLRDYDERFSVRSHCQYGLPVCCIAFNCCCLAI